MSSALDELRARIGSIKQEGLDAIAQATDSASLEQVQIRIFGRKSSLSSARGSLGALDDDARKESGKLINDVQAELKAALDERAAAFASVERQQRWDDERVDVTLPGRRPEVGLLHPLTRTMWEIVDIFIGLGYLVAEGPEVELSRYNFDGLNIPPEHPSRAHTDTYYVGSGDDVCLRVHTSPVQVRVMESQEPPVYVVAPGRVYRRDTLDATHSNVFHQIEGLAVDTGITMSDLKGSLEVFARQVFGKGLNVRLRPHYFPFTEPSAEMDVECFKCRGSDPRCRLCKGEGWIEILGCGMVHPSLFEWAGYDPERYTGFAFGMGVERIAMLANGINDLRYFWENDSRFLGQFAGVR